MTQIVLSSIAKSMRVDSNGEATVFGGISGGFRIIFSWFFAIPGRFPGHFPVISRFVYR